MSVEPSVRQTLTGILVGSATADPLARLLWTRLHCDPADPDTAALWERMPADVRLRFGDLAAAARDYLARTEGWARPQRWDSVHDIPLGQGFVPDGDTRKFVLLGGDGALALPPAEPLLYPIAEMDDMFRHGYREVR